MSCPVLLTYSFLRYDDMEEKIAILRESPDPWLLWKNKKLLNQLEKPNLQGNWIEEEWIFVQKYSFYFLYCNSIHVKNEIFF